LRKFNQHIFCSDFYFEIEGVCVNVRFDFFIFTLVNIMIHIWDLSRIQIKKLNQDLLNLFEYYDFSLGHFSIRVHFKNSKKSKLIILKLNLWALSVIYNEKVINYKVAKLFEYYHFCIISPSKTFENFKNLNSIDLYWC
jgi:hypothetical protein